jgi:heptaprenyl diphosphate synthase
MTNGNRKQNENIEYIEFDKALDLVKKEVDTTLSTSPRIIRGYTKHLLASRGKFIRAISVIMCAETKDGLVHPNAIKIAAAIEILHLATLVHDDVIDNADIRRGDITLQKQYGKRTAVICGDYLLCTALNLASSISNKQDYLELDIPDYMGRVCLGELNQHIKMPI